MSLVTVVLLLLGLASVVAGGLGYFGRRDKGSIAISTSGLLIVLIVLFVTGRL